MKTKTAARFLIAKYVPDLKRMEPRNVGVFLWANGQIRCRFLDQPGFVTDPTTYERWREFWNAEISGTSVSPLRGAAVPISDPACMDALLTSQKGNYLLVDAGEMLDSIRGRDIKSALDFLFDELVSPTGKPTKSELQQTFTHTCHQLVRESGLRGVEGFRPKFDFSCPVYGVRKHMQFSYGIGSDDRPASLYQRVHVDNDSSVHDAALKLHAAIQHAAVDKSRCVALIQESQIERSKNGAADNRKLLESLCQVVNVEDHDLAISKLREAAGITA